MGNERAFCAEEPSARGGGLLVDIRSGTACIDHLHTEPPEQTTRWAGRMLVRKEPNTRAWEQVRVITTECAVQHPGQTILQALGTIDISTLGPAFGLRFYHFHARVCAQPMGNNSDSYDVRRYRMLWVRLPCNRPADSGNRKPSATNLL
jgi:hypothetical protein